MNASAGLAKIRTAEASRAKAIAGVTELNAAKGLFIVHGRCGLVVAIDCYRVSALLSSAGPIRLACARG